MKNLSLFAEKTIALIIGLVNTLYHNIALVVSPSYRNWFERKMFLEEQKIIQEDQLTNMKYKDLIDKVVRDSKVILNVLMSFDIKREQVKQRENGNYFFEDYFAKYDLVDYKKVQMYLLPTFTGGWSHMSAIIEMTDGKIITLAWRKNNRLIDHVCITVKEAGQKKYDMAIAIPTDKHFGDEGSVQAIKEMFLSFEDFSEVNKPYDDSRFAVI